jgi:hypothetical protein
LFSIVVLGLIAWILSSYLAQAQAQAQPLLPQQQQEQPPLNIRVINAGGPHGDDRYTRAPKPERDWIARPDWSAVWNAPTATLPTIATRGLPEAYQSMGVLTMENGQVLPLYGRRTGSRSDRFQYYTRTDTYNPVQLPLRYKNRDCQDDVGCEEIMDGEILKVAATGSEGKATMYRFSGPTYVPVV